MSATGVSVRRRPVRVGWCVRHGNHDQLRATIRLTSALWGGRYNPIIDVDQRDLARDLIDLFKVDVLYAVTSDEVIDSFIKNFPHIQWPSLLGPIVRTQERSGIGRSSITLVDAYTALNRARKQAKEEETLVNENLPKWEDEDPLADCLLATFGAYPTDQIGEAFEAMFSVIKGNGRSLILPTEPLPTALMRSHSPLMLSGYELYPSRGGLKETGLFVGDATSAEDLIDYWNLRAAGQAFIFYDPRHESRMRAFGQHFIHALEERVARLHPDAWERRLTVISRDQQGLPESLSTELQLLRGSLDPVIWNGLNVKPPSVATLSETSVGTVSVEGERPTLTFQTDDSKLFDADPFERQRYVLIASPHLPSSKEGTFTFFVPNFAQLNVYYGRAMLANPQNLRAGPDGVGIITEIGRNYQTLIALSVEDIFRELFAHFGIEAKPSRAGLIAKRLIHQMGGLQKCRVFKIEGVRNLIRKFSPSKAFTRGQALQTIGENFTRYEDLYIRPRRHAKLLPDEAFDFLVEKGVFRAGLTFLCPSCQLDFWVSLDDAKTWLECEYCGERFNCTTQLGGGKAQAWQYRRSGLFGKDNHQEGGIPVALSLQRLDTSVGSVTSEALYTTALELVSKDGGVRCEIDFAFLTQGIDGHAQLAIGEAKAHDHIDDIDVANLTKISGALADEAVNVYRVFAKAGIFSPDELGRCLEPKDTWPRRAILLSRLELEPYELFSVYERFGIQPHYADRLEDLAEASYQIYGGLTQPSEADSTAGPLDTSE
jgi:hypothetical protein